MNFIEELTGMQMGLSAGYSSATTKTNSTTSGTSKTTNRAFDDVAKGQLDAFTAQLLAQVKAGTNPAYSKESAISDTRDAISQIFTDYREQDLPQILSLQGKTGTYSNTATQQLANDAFARTVGKAGALTLDTIAKYAGIQQSGKETDLASLLGALQLQRDAFSVQDVVQTSTTSGKSKKSGFNLGLKLG